MNESHDEKYTFNTGVILAGAFLLIFFLNIYVSGFSPFQSLLKNDLSISYEQLGLITSVFFVGYILGQVPWGIVADKYGVKRIMAISMLGIAVCTVLFGLAVSYWEVVVSRFFAGLLGAGIFAPSVKLASMWFKPKKRGTALGIMNLGGSLGLVFASYLSPFLALDIGWRGALVLYGLLGVLSSVLGFLTLRDRKLPRLEKEPEMSKVVRYKSFWLLGVIQFIRFGTYNTLLVWLPIFMQEQYGLDIIIAGVAFSLFNWAGVFSNPIGGFASDRRGEKAIIFISLLATAMAILFFIGVKTLLVLFLAIFIMGWFINFPRSPLFTIIPKLWGTEMAGKASGVQNMFAAIGGLAIPFLIGYTRDMTGSYYTGWIILSATLIAGTLLNQMIKDSRQELSAR